jgi:hypothetical protein
MNNFASLRKMVFIKEKVVIKPKTFKNNKLDQNRKSTDASNRSAANASTIDESHNEKSLLTTLIDSNTEN